MRFESCRSALIGRRKADGRTTATALVIHHHATDHQATPGRCLRNDRFASCVVSDGRRFGYRHSESSNDPISLSLSDFVRVYVQTDRRRYPFLPARSTLVNRQPPKCLSFDDRCSLYR